MALKKINFTFSIDAPVFAAMLTQASACRVDFEGQPTKLKRANGQEPGLLSPPKGANGRGGLRSMIKGALKDGDKTVDQLRDVAEKQGYSRKSVASQIDLLKKDGEVKAGSGRGVYVLTTKGAK